MKFNCFGKTKIVLTLVMAVLILFYVLTMTGSFLKYESIDYETDEAGYPIQDENGDPIEIIKKVDASQLSFIWFPTEHAKTLGSQLEAFSENDYEYNVNDVAPILVLLFVLGIIVVILALVSLYTKNAVLWSTFGAIWGILAAYCYIMNPAMRAAGEIACLSEAGILVMIQSILAFVGCVVGIAAFVISVYAKRKNRKLLMESILKRD